MRSIGLWRANAIPGAAVLLLVASLPYWLIQTSFVLSIATLTLVFMAASLGWNIISGFGGQISFGHSIFFGLGAYSCAIMEGRYHTSAWIALLVGVGFTLAVCCVLGSVTFRLKGIYFGLATYALTLMFALLFGHFNYTGGEVGLTLPLGEPSFAAMRFGSKLGYYYLALILASIGFAVGLLVIRSRLGIQLQAIQADEDAARASGVIAFRVKLIALFISATITTLAGAVYMQYIGFVDPNSVFGPYVATQIAVIAFVGGSGRVWGPVIGAVILVPLQQTLNTSLSSLPAGVNLVFYAIVVIVILWIEPRGILAMRWRRRGKDTARTESTGKESDVLEQKLMPSADGST